MQTSVAAAYPHEVGVLTHAGREFAAMGAVRDGNHLAAYLGKDNVLTTWGGEPIGTYRITRSWRIRSFLSDTVSQVYATLDDGSRWTGRSLGVGMLFSGRPVKR